MLSKPIIYLEFHSAEWKPHWHSDASLFGFFFFFKVNDNKQKEPTLL